jgi:S1-C subfamily serine protease
MVAGLGVSWLIRPAGTKAPVGTSSSYLDASAIAAKVDPAVVDIVTTLGYQNGQAAGTGIVLTSTGEVLTNNHVIEGATSIEATDVGNGKTYTATVVGYDTSADVAVLQLQGASGLRTATLGDSAKVTVGESVVAVGNAGGVGGTPSVATGSVTALGQSITASDEASGTSEQLSGLIETDADLQPGDSGGPLVDATGAVIGMDTAAASGFQFQSASNQAYAIPIDEALSIAAQIEAGHASSTIHIGSTAFLGVEISGTYGDQSAGAVIAGVVNGSPAANAGLAAGDVITSLGGKAVDSAAALSTAISQYHPGDKVTISWTSLDGQTHSATLVLANGPAA